MEVKNNKNYQNYIGIEWSQEIVVLARMRSNSSSIVETVSMQPSLEQLKEYLHKLPGSKILTIEETTTSHWLYVELCKEADRIIICDPYRNSLMKDGPKNDKRDAGTLCLLLRNGLLKEVYHSDDKLFELRKFISVYIDFVKSSVRIKNQQSALYRSVGKRIKKEKQVVETIQFEGELLNFVANAQAEAISYLKQSRDKFEHQMDIISKTNTDVRRLKKISGIGKKFSVIIAATVIDMNRFENKYRFWSYCGLVKYERESGGRLYGKKSPRYSRILKGVFKSAATAAISGNNDIRDYYEYLIQKGLTLRNARNEIARYIAKSVYGVMKYKTEYRSYQWQENKTKAA